MLLGISYCLHQLRIQVVIYTLHNIADPLLQAAKLFKCGSELGATLLFVPFALLLCQRLILPYVCYYTIFFGPGYQRKLYKIEIFSMGLLCLLIPSAYWFYLIAKMAIKSIRGPRSWKTSAATLRTSTSA